MEHITLFHPAEITRYKSLSRLKDVISYKSHYPKKFVTLRPLADENMSKTNNELIYNRLNTEILLLVQTPAIDSNILEELSAQYSLSDLKRYKGRLTGAVIIHLFNHDYTACRLYEQKFRTIVDELIATRTRLDKEKNEDKIAERIQKEQKNIFSLFLPTVQKLAELHYYLDSRESSSLTEDENMIADYVNEKHRLYEIAKANKKLFRRFAHEVHNQKDINIIPHMKLNSLAEIGEINKNIISEIDNTYNLLYSVHKGQTTIVPASLPKQNCRLTQANSLVATIPWTDVAFCDGYIRITIKDKYYYIQDTDARAQYNAILRTFSKRLGCISVQISGNTATLTEYVEYERVIALLDLIALVNSEKGHKALHDGSIKFLNTPSNIIKKIFPLDKTPYINHLQELQLVDAPIIPCFEDNNMHYPDSFLFTVNCTSSRCIIWESCDSTSKKSSYAFIKPYDVELSEFQAKIFQYVSSPLNRKRELLRTHSTLYFKDITYFSIDHDGFNAWADGLSKVLRRTKTNNKIKSQSHRSSVSAKNEGVIAYSSTSRTITYERSHNRLQNLIKEQLEKSGNYICVELEKDYIDILATKKGGSIEYYEVKTYDSPKRCIREGLGQLLEYVYYFDKPLPQKLIIVGSSPLDEKDAAYISKLQTEHNLCLNYKWFNESLKTLV